MNKPLPVFLLFLVIVFEGYAVLSSELLAIRQSIPFVGSGTDTVSIIIAAVLMPLAFGYQSGGNFRPGCQANGRYQSVRKKLIKNIIISMSILLFGLSHLLINIFFVGMIELGITNRLILTALYSSLFLVTPVYLLGQTIPLISNYFSREKLSEITGKILFFSTFGSFLGAVFSTLVLMATIGVHHTAALNFVILAALVILLSKRKLSDSAFLAIGITTVAIYINTDKMMASFNIVENNKYNTITFTEQKVDGDTQRFLSLNNNNSSMFSEKGRKHDYIEFIERIAIDPIKDSKQAPKEILVIGAGGFTLGHEDTHNRYEYIDIDKSLKGLAEKYLLKEQLKDNKTFHPIPARAFISQTEKEYDLIVLDAYLGALTLPEHLVTQDFFQQIKSKSKTNGIIIANFITSPTFDSTFSRTLENTLRSVFPHITREIIGENSVWNDDIKHTVNAIYVYKNHDDFSASTQIYTDNKNRVFYDQPK